MATMALQFRTLSADIQVEAACAQKQIVRLRPRKARFSPRTWVQTLILTRIIGHYCGKLTSAEEQLVLTLQKCDFTAWTDASVKSLASDLDRIVSLSTAVIEKSRETPDGIVETLAPKLDRIAELTSYIDSIAESLHAEADPECMTLLAFAAEHAEKGVGLKAVSQ